ncbi:cytochrome c family protein [Telmatospirillum sp. J64-1]|uniref:c-type cytochrome n=1 Tax=Telmatospirillum sp. J64-1 TaxID=2502183 RepID=UPI001C8F37F3|nr:c-type cytochrome [Telmatospirillum sp. J64-1]
MDHPLSPLAAPAAMLVALSCLALLTGCESEVPDHLMVPGGDVRAGREAIRDYGCGACHVIPGIRGARGAVGPPLEGFSHRAYIAGQIPNRPEELIQWLADPPAMIPGTAMPGVGLTPQQKRDVAAYLYTLR